MSLPLTAGHPRRWPLTSRRPWARRAPWERGGWGLGAASPQSPAAGTRRGLAKRAAVGVGASLPALHAPASKLCLLNLSASVSSCVTWGHRSDASLKRSGAGLAPARSRGGQWFLRGSVLPERPPRAWAPRSWQTPSCSHRTPRSWAQQPPDKGGKGLGRLSSRWARTAEDLRLHASRGSPRGHGPGNGICHALPEEPMKTQTETWL